MKSSGSIVDILIEKEIQASYLEYSMSVIVSRALPDCRDGFKPVHRRIMYAMHEMGITHDKPYRKSAKIVGEVLAKYHPHGDSAVYSSMVRMAQKFSLRDTLVEGQGNFGSIDGDSPAQMRYTEVRLEKIANTLVSDIQYDTVDFQPNYDGSEKEPTVLPARFPNILVNGASGIAVGMATNIPPHNLGEVMEACIAYLKNPEITAHQLTEYVLAPDFPTGAEILGRARAIKALISGRGSITLRGKASFEDIGGKKSIVITELPYQVNKSELVKSIESLVKDKIIEGVSEIRDETNKLGIRVVIDLKKGAEGELILNQLYKNTQLQVNFGVNMLAINKGIPVQMNLLEFIAAFIEFRKEVVLRRTTFLLQKAREKAHLLIGLALALANIDRVVELIRLAGDVQEARAALLNELWYASEIEAIIALVEDEQNKVEDSRCRFTEFQVKAILEMRLQRLTALERGKIDSELQELVGNIKYYLNILSSEEELCKIIESELLDIKERFATPRLTEIVDDVSTDIDDIDLIKKEDVVVKLTASGYIKRVPISMYKAQKRGGKGRSALSMHEDDAVTELLITNTHATVLFFSDIGKVYSIKVYKIPQGSLQSKGRALVNIIPLANGEKVASVMQIYDNSAQNLVFVTSKGNIRRNELSDFENIQTNGKIAIRLSEDDSLVGAALCDESDHVFLATKKGKALRFPVSAVRVFKSRTSDGVRAIKLARSNDSVVSLSILNGIEVSNENRDEYLKIPVEKRIALALGQDVEIEDSMMEIENIKHLAKNEQFLLSITSRGFGKRTSAYEYRTTDRAGQGILNVSFNAGDVLATFPVWGDDDIMLITDCGTTIRTSCSEIRFTGRGACGVRIISLKGGEALVAAVRLCSSEDDE
ncbi:DNA gyrase subunit A [Candidatus Cyrtobacter comes]|uniref:DNA gyrase subunit A n=1 Tax=Candidatus Cyrtobacter comes TaxID=675776 RepID=A0ABU5L7D7_9RICK|nr:DNA gyrase subunit A [Candidatus Cyrtobacter comes]MDZ5762044.1 DNA gyrase subunit A [Candidatus Cyrtobacter comes]